MTPFSILHFSPQQVRDLAILHRLVWYEIECFNVQPYLSLSLSLCLILTLNGLVHPALDLALLL